MISDESSSSGELRTVVIGYRGDKIMITLHNSITDMDSAVTWVNLSTKTPPSQTVFKGLTKSYVSTTVFFNVISNLFNNGGVILEMS